MPEHKPSIKEWSVADRPREKLSQLGLQAMSDTDLLAILIATGSGADSALDLARKVLKACQGDLQQLQSMTHIELNKIKGVGPAKSATILAALELGRRAQVSSGQAKKIVLTSKDGAALFDHLKLATQEEFWMASLNIKSVVLDVCKVHMGGISRVLTDMRVIFSKALEFKATGIIVAHNHPSGVAKPSAEDEALTKTIKEAGKLLQINLLDHLIITKNSFYSFSDEGSL